MKHFERLDSTNAYALRNMEQLEDKDMIVADVQTSGRGRFDREWISGNCANLYLTFVLKSSDYAQNLTQYLSVVLVRVLKKYGVDAQIKWPNDVLVNGGKIAGILCESFVSGGKIKGLALGIGVNLNMSADELDKIPQKAVSLNMLAGKKIDKKEFVRLLSEEFFRFYDEFLTNGFLSIKDEYENYSNFLEKEVWISDREGKKPYFAKSVNPDGSLNLRGENGCEKTIYSGDMEV